ncbi:hypothetical protein MTR_3g061710 [Medicago truncatula]|uniref:Uncharacterized protein n=1 Tax=Medicago truncatula TaxID=3880 RepID=G7J273_MEDTR|nr:hypothetical protein MTR_3g061710 [Medicago truncatula]
MRMDEISAVMMKRKDQTYLVDLCVEKAIDNVKYLGDVSHVDHHMMDLSHISNKLWKKFIEKQFGIICTNEVVKDMKEKIVSFTWLKQSRKIKTCTKIPPSKRRLCGGNGPRYNFSNVKSSNIMKKSKKYFLNCLNHDTQFNLKEDI